VSFFGDPLGFEEELIPSTSVGTVLVQLGQIVDDLTTDMAEKQREDQQSEKFPDLRIVGPWSDAITDLDYTQDSSPLCGSFPSRNEVLNQSSHMTWRFCNNIFRREVMLNTLGIDFTLTRKRERRLSII